MSIAPFVHRSAPSRVILRDGAIGLLAGELQALDVQRPLLLCGAHARRSVAFTRVMEGLAGCVPLVSEPVPAHSSVALVERLVDESRCHGVDGFIALGGGSASDTAKAVALLLAEGGKLADYALRLTAESTLVAPELRRPKLPIVSIPATASGAEVSAGLGVRDADGRKLIFNDVRLVSRLILLDPVANLEVPAALMISTGMNGLAHCFEGLYSRERSPIAETLALESIARFASALPAVHREPTNAAHRGDLLYAGHLSGLVLLNAKTCLHHAICHLIGSVTAVGHGDANSVLLPHVLAFNREAASAALQRAAVALGGDADSAADDATRLLTRLREEIGAPRRLRDIGVGADSLAPIAQKVMGASGLHYNPRPVSGPAEILELLEAAF